MDGKYFSPNGESFESRALAPYMEGKEYNQYKVIKDFDVKSGTIAPWWEQSGMGTQYYTDIKITDFEGNLVPATVENLEKYEYIINLNDL